MFKRVGLVLGSALLVLFGPGVRLAWSQTTGSEDVKVVEAEGEQPSPAGAEAAPEAGQVGQNGDNVGETEPAPAGAGASQQQEALIDFSFDHASLDTVLEVLFRAGGYIFIQETESLGSITIRNMQKLTLEEALNVLNSVLRAKGATLQQTGRKKIYRVISLDQAKSSAGPVRRGSDPSEIADTDEVITQVIQLRYATASSLVKELTGLVSKNYANLTANDDSNTLIITDSSSNVRRIASIIKELDVPSIPAAEIKVIPLKKADAAEVANVLSRLFVTTSSTKGRSSTAQRFIQMRTGRREGSSTAGTPTSAPQAAGRQLVKIASDERTNSIIVAAPQELMPAIEELIKELDGEDVGQMLDVRVYLLQNADANDVANMVNGVFTPGRQEQSARRRIGWVQVMQETGGGPGTRAVLKEAIRVSVDKRLNALIVVATPENLALIDKLVVEVDQPTEPRFHRVVPVENLDPEELSTLLEKIIQAPKGTQSRPSTTPSRAPSSSWQRRGPGSYGRRQSSTGDVNAKPGQEKMASSSSGRLGQEQTANGGLVLASYEAEAEKEQQDTRAVYDLSTEVSVSYDESTGSIILTGPRGALDAAEELIKTLDTQPAVGEVTFIVHLNNADAVELAGVVSELFGGGAARRTTSARRTTTGASTSVRRSSSRQSGSSRSSGSGRRSENTTDTQEELNLAADGGYVPIALTSSVTGEVTIVPDQNTQSLIIRTHPRNVEVVQQLIAELDKAPAQVLIQVLLAERRVEGSNEFGVEFTNYDTDRAGGGSDAIWGFQFGLPKTAEGLSYSLVSDNVEAFLLALEREGKLDVLSRPQVLVADNKEASITVGESVPFITNSRITSEGSIINSISYEDVGIMLSVTPHINPEGQVNMEIAPEISSVGESTIAISEFVNATTFPTRNANTTVSIRDGQTILIGGLMADSVEERREKVPLLGDLPVLGFLFRHTEKEKVKTELLIVLTPRVVRSAEQLQELSDQERASSTIPPHPDFKQLQRRPPYTVEPSSNPEEPRIQPE